METRMDGTTNNEIEENRSVHVSMPLLPAPGNKETQTTPEDILGDNILSLKLENMGTLLKLRQAMDVMKPKKSEGSPQKTEEEERKETDEEFEKLLFDIADMDIKKGDQSINKYTTTKSVGGGLLKIGLLELTVVALKELQMAGKDVEPYYNVLLAVYVIMIIMEIVGLAIIAYLSLFNLRELKSKKWSLILTRLNNFVVVLASAILILGTIAASLKSDRNENSALKKLMDKLNEMNITLTT